MSSSVSVRRRPLAIALAALPLAVLPAAVAHAQGTTPLREVAVTATRSTQEVDFVPGTATSIDRAGIERIQANDIADLFRDEPDVSISANTVRFGTGSINIRGIEDSRVLLLIDGVRAADQRDAGTTNYTGSVRDMPEPDFLKQVDILRGPASSLYGSDAIGGVVGFQTLDPEDFLKDGKTSAHGAKFSYFGENNGAKGSFWAAGASGRFQGLVMVSRQDNGETETMGDRNVFGMSRTTANPLDARSVSLLAKLVFAPRAGHELRLAVETKDKQTNTDIQRISNYSPRSPTSLGRITRNDGDDSLRRERLTLDYLHKPGAGWYDRLSAKAYWQRQATDNLNYQRRSSASLNATWGCSATTAGAGNCDVNQHYEFTQALFGASVVLEKTLRTPAPQFLTWGLDLLRTTTEESKNTTWTNLATGVTSNRFIGETYPLSEYPKGRVDHLGLFGQDEIHLLDGRLRLTPGLRHDSFDMQPESNDPLYHPVAGRTAVAKKGSRLSPKLAASFEVAPQWQTYAQYVEGFKAPTYEQVNRYFSNNQALYAIVGNPELKPETSKGWELGLRAGDRELGGQVSVYWNRYGDFIETVSLAASDPAFVAGMTSGTSQYRNLTNVAIHGHELRGHWQARKDLRLTAAYAYGWGEYEKTPGIRLPLNSVEPRRLSLSAQWTPSLAWGLETRVRAAARQSRVDDTDTLSSTNAIVFRPGGYAVVDLGGWWQVARNARLALTVNNLFDRKHWLWSTARRLTAADLGPEFHTQPGRNLVASLKLDF